jgi:CRISPR-associated endoribonuclease Cas6
VFADTFILFEKEKYVEFGKIKEDSLEIFRMMLIIILIGRYLIILRKEVNMHILVTLSSANEVKLPIHYNQLLQGIIYKTIDTELAQFLHDEGYQSGNRTFKMFSYSRLAGQFRIEKGTGIIFCGDIQWTISSPVLKFCESIAEGLLMKDNIRIGTCQVAVKSIEIQRVEVKNEKITLKTLSPIVAYSTLFRADGRKYTCYYQAGESDYDVLIENNLRKKYQAIYSCEAPLGNVKVKNIGQMKMNLINYKGTIIKGYSGLITLTGPKELLQIGLDGGIGGKGSQGFGCVKMVK